MKLVKSTYDKQLFGVCGGIANYFGIDATLVRIIFAICTIAGIGSPILIYLIMAVIMPEDSGF